LFVCIFVDYPGWSDLQGKKELSKEDFKLPDETWGWENNGQWIVEKSEKTDPDGWVYGHNFRKEDAFVKETSVLRAVRKRIWIRTCSKLVSFD